MPWQNQTAQLQNGGGINVQEEDILETDYKSTNDTRSTIKNTHKKPAELSGDIDLKGFETWQSKFMAYYYIYYQTFIVTFIVTCLDNFKPLFLFIGSIAIDCRVKIHNSSIIAQVDLDVSKFSSKDAKF